MSLLSKIAATIAHEAEAITLAVENLLGSGVGQSITEEAASIVTGILIKAEVPAAQQSAVADYVYSVSSGIYTLSTGEIPTVAALSDYLTKFTDGSALLASVVSALSSEYATIYAALEKNADAAKAIAFFNALAAGVEAGAKTYADAATIAAGTPAPIA